MTVRRPSVMAAYDVYVIALTLMAMVVVAAQGATAPGEIRVEGNDVVVKPPPGGYLRAPRLAVQAVSAPAPSPAPPANTLTIEMDSNGNAHINTTGLTLGGPKLFLNGRDQAEMMSRADVDVLLRRMSANAGRPLLSVRNRLGKVKKADRSRSVSAVLGPRGPIVVMQSPSSEIVATFCHNMDCTSFQNTTVVPAPSSGTIGKYTSAAVTADGRLMVAYIHEGPDDLSLAICSDLFCESLVSRPHDSLLTSGNVGAHPSLQVTSTGLPAVAHADFTLGRQLMTVCSDVNCTGPVTSRIVDSATDVGAYCSLALTDDDQAVIAYNDGANKDLKLALCPDLTCTDTGAKSIQTIMSLGSVGWFANVAIRNGLPVVAAYDYSTPGEEFVRIAFCANLACTSAAEQTFVRTPNWDVANRQVCWHPPKAEGQIV